MYIVTRVNCYTCTCTNLAPAQDPKLYIYDIEGDSIVQRQDLDLSAPLTEITFSPDGAYLGAASTARAPLLLDANNSFNVSKGDG